MKQLLTEWRKYLQEVEILEEDMKTPDDLPEDTFICIQQRGEKYFSVFYSDSEGRRSPPGPGLIYGIIKVGKRDQGPDFDGGNCSETMIVAMTDETTHGWGPLLYDIAIEWSSKIANGLAPDRSAVSPYAYAVWKKYLNNRPDVIKTQLDNPENELTDTDTDNCGQDSAMHYSQENWSKDPLSKMYTKKEPVMIKKLQSMNKLIIR